MGLNVTSDLFWLSVTEDVEGAREPPSVKAKPITRLLIKLKVVRRETGRRQP